MLDRQKLRRAFEDPAEFTTSPLYRALSRTVAAHDELLDLAASGRPGQYPTFLFFGAVHHLLLRGADHALARFFPSIAGAQALPAVGCRAALVSFCGAFGPELAETISTRLVQTSQVQRALGLRLGLSMIAHDVAEPVHLIEVGASAGLNLRFDRYGYQVGGRRSGDPASPVQLSPACTARFPRQTWTCCRGSPPCGVSTSTRSMCSTPMRAAGSRRSSGRRTTGSVPCSARPWTSRRPTRRSSTQVTPIDVLPGIAADLPAGEPRVVFHAATRMHVPEDRRDAFDAAIARLNDGGPLWWLSIEDRLIPIPVRARHVPVPPWSSARRRQRPRPSPWWTVTCAG